ncbi:COP9 signalosome, subunit CSN8 [Prunus dulcis]|uniref:COP9 signalosome, subunit CSN8 n=1 Tax=Prunus dulcis TaxID=3755 RepID=A0A4Y1QW94_PRUDU|nr:COP9 signalosome, subunit CSN8 [Prunus dulcis]
MDFSLLSEALNSKSYEKVADICDEHMLQVAAEGVAFQDDWPYAIHLLGHIYAGDIQEGNPEVIAAWKIGQKLWVRDYGGVYEAIRGYDWSQEAQDLYTKNMFQLLQSAYSTISIQDTALFLGMSEDDATTCKLLFSQICTTARLGCGPCFSNAYCEDAAHCYRAETGCQKIAELDRICIPSRALKELSRT